MNNQWSSSHQNPYDENSRRSASNMNNRNDGNQSNQQGLYSPAGGWNNDHFSSNPPVSNNNSNVDNMAVMPSDPLHNQHFPSSSPSQINQYMNRHRQSSLGHSLNMRNSNQGLSLGEPGHSHFFHGRGQQHMNQLMNSQMNQQMNRPTHQPIHQPINHPMNQQLNQQLNQQMNFPRQHVPQNNNMMFRQQGQNATHQHSFPLSPGRLNPAITNQIEVTPERALAHGIQNYYPTDNTDLFRQNEQRRQRWQDDISRTVSKGSGSTSSEGEKQNVENPSVICRCVKSRCLKLYCDCFQTGILCNTQCKCVKCLNTESENQKGGRLKLAKRDYLLRKPKAFGKKEKKAGDGCACKNNR